MLHISHSHKQFTISETSYLSIIMLLNTTFKLIHLAANISKPVCSTTIRNLSTRLYTKKHEWITIKDNGEVGRVGISNHAQEALGDVVYVQVPDIGSKFSQYDEVGAIESVKAASELVTPVSGEILSVNSRLEQKPSLVNSDCYGEGWLFEVKIQNSTELDQLMNEDKYNEYLKTEES